MTSGALSIHVRVRYASVVISNSDAVVHFVLARHIILGNILDVYSTHGVVSNLKIGLRAVKQVLNFLHVNLDHTDLHFEGNMCICLADLVENVRNDARNDSALFRRRNVGAGHGMRFARTCLAVGQDRAVVSFHHAFDDRLGHVVKDSVLRGKSVKYAVKSVFNLLSRAHDLCWQLNSSIVEHIHHWL